MEMPTVYTIVYSAADSDRGCYPFSEARGSYLSLSAAQEELERQIAAERAELAGRYDTEERTDDSWEMYQDGFAAAAFSQLKIIESTLKLDQIA